MPIVQTHKMCCSQCDWAAVWRGGDVIFFPRQDCPRCGAALRLSMAGPLDRINPLLRLNYARLLVERGQG